ncbi:MAG: STAS domain-containing protein [Actinomycetota bacterium]|nr:STAS domain-containing protein [Actinomycetota bacterium]
MDELDDEANPPMTFTILAQGGETTVVTINGELDIANIQGLEVALAPLIETRPARLVLDLGGVGFADSSAIALLVRWATAVDELKLRDASPLLQKVIETMGLAGKLQLEP